MSTAHIVSSLKTWLFPYEETKTLSRDVVIAEARRWAADPEFAKRLMAVDEGPYQCELGEVLEKAKQIRELTNNLESGKLLLMKNWIFKDGNSVTECDSFPYAYRLMHNTFRKGLEKGSTRNVPDMLKQMSIVSPAKDVHGRNRTYSYATATQLAKDQGLLTGDGEINSREFKKKY